MNWGARATVAVAVVMAGFAAGAADAFAYDAHGSVGQVYVTGLAPNARMSLLNRRGHRVQRKRADAQGGLLFRSVKAGTGYRVRLGKGPKSAPLTVLSKRSAPPSTSVYNQTIPDNGYGYLTTRDGTRL